MLKSMTVRTTIAAILFGLSISAHAIADTKRVNIPAGELRQALLQVSEQFGADIVFSPGHVQGFKTQGAHGELTTEQAITKLLEGTPLQLRTDPSGAMLIAPPATAVTSSSTLPVRGEGPGVGSRDEGKGFWSRLRLAQSTPPSPSDGRRVGDEGSQGPGSSDANSPDPTIDEVVVTGTHIRGAVPIGSPLLVIDREEIDASGRGRVQDFLETIPQNFSGSISEDSTLDRGAANETRGQAIDLRGLGASSTLVLVNGRRQPSGGTQGSFVDISSIATSAIERVEILTDGASALYGSDAIAGVVNFVLRKDFTGAETGVRVGTFDGDGQELRVSQLFGATWDGGNVLVGYEYADRDMLMADETNYGAFGGDYRALGGSDFRSAGGNPATILNPTTLQPAFAIPGGQDGTSLTVDQLRSGGNYYDGLTDVAVLPEQATHSAFVYATHAPSDRLELFAEGRYGQRDMTLLQGGYQGLLSVPATNAFYLNPFGTTGPVRVIYDFGADLGAQRLEGDTRTLVATVGARAGIGGDWQLEMAATHGTEDSEFVWMNRASTARINAALADSNPQTALNVYGDGANTNPATIEGLRNTEFSTGDFTMRSVTAVADGPLFELPTGRVRMAVGADYREEELEAVTGSVLPVTNTVTTALTSVGRMDRRVKAAFAEITAPIINSEGGAKLDLSVSGRYEEYSDFGSTSDPRVGISFTPLQGLHLRSSWGTSFRAPRFNELSPNPSVNVPGAAAVLNAPDPRAADRTSNVLRIIGVDSELQPETAKMWTAGFDYSPTWVEGLTVSTTYFDIDYEDKIQQGGAGNSTLLQEAQWQGIILRDPTPAQIAAVCNRPDFNPVNGCPSDVAAILDLRLRNLGGVEAKGLDLKVRQRSDLSWGQLDFSLTGTYVFSYERSNTPGSAFVDVLDSVTNPLDLRLRGSAGWSWQSLQVNAFVNYQDGYEDSGQGRHVESWTTIDAGLAYDLSSHGFLDSTRLRLSVVNLTDKEPPFVNRSGGFDAANASDRGRTWSLEVTTQW